MKGNKILHNVKTQWISMLGPARRVFEEYKTLIKKMAIGSHKEPVAKKNLKLLLEWELMLAHLRLLQMVYALNTLIKYTQSHACYMKCGARKLITYLSSKLEF